MSGRTAKICYHESMKWLFFSYSLPTEPSKARVYVWRQLKKLGAVNVQSIWVLPHSTERITEVKKLIETIEAYKGSGLLISGNVLLEDQEDLISKAVIESRNEEYREFIAKCEAFFREIESEIGKENFIFAEVEENEEELAKLKQWLKKIEKRDVVKPPLRKEAIAKLKMSERLFDDFARRVYDRQQVKTKK